MEFEYYLQLAIEEYLEKFGDDGLTVHLLYKLIARANELQNEAENRLNKARIG